MSGDHSHGKHATVKLYWVFCVVLCAITFGEWFIFRFREELGVTSTVMVPALIVMSLVKFVMVVGWYMHLRYDHSWLKFIFIGSLGLGGATGIALAILM